MIAENPVGSIEPMSLEELNYMSEKHVGHLVTEVFLNYESFLKTHQSKDPEILLKLVCIDARIFELSLHKHNEKLVNDLINEQSFWINLYEIIKRQKVEPPCEQFWINLKAFLYGFPVHQLKEFPKMVKKFSHHLKSLAYSPEVENVLKVLKEMKSRINCGTEMYPIINDLKEKSERFCNNVLGEYLSVNEYVQLNLHLLKRDFLESIITGIQNFFESKNQSGISVDSKISFYPNSRVIQVENFLTVNFNFKKSTEKLSGINLKKEFAYGQLLFLTSGADLTDLIVARVMKTDENLISKGSVKVEIVRTENVENPLHRNYIMFVCKSFAELYFHNFITIRNLHEFNFPFAEYFLKVKEINETPDYLSNNSDNWTGQAKSYMEAGQFEAFKSSLTQKLTVIKGVPGSGKTFVTLEIIETLFAKTDNQIFLLTSTNDALDKLLLEATNFCNFRKIARLGRPSENSKVNGFNVDFYMKHGNSTTQKYYEYLKNQRENLESEMQQCGTLEDVQAKQQSISNLHDLIRENTLMDTYKMFCNKRIIGMSTEHRTFSLDRKSVLTMLRKPIVIVHNANDILETDLIAMLSSNVQQIILVGEHIDRIDSMRFLNSCDYSISLFERLILNKVNVASLNVQFRMSAPIADLIKAAFHPSLQNHSSVAELAVKGTPYNLAWIDYKKEKSHNHFVLKICNHLIKEGNNAEKITILTTSFRNSQNIQHKMRERLENFIVRVAYPKTYKIEENDIILLSLNYDESVDEDLLSPHMASFLLSRAKFGLFIIGDTRLFKKVKDSWKLVFEHLSRNKMVMRGFVSECEHGRKLHSKTRDFVEESCDLCKGEPVKLRKTDDKSKSKRKIQNDIVEELSELLLESDEE